MNIQINAEDIDRFVKEALVKSAIGDTVQKALNEAINGYSSPLRNQLQHTIAVYAREVIEERFGETIREQIAAHIEKAVTAELTEKVVSESVNKMVKAMEDRY